MPGQGHKLLMGGGRVSNSFYQRAKKKPVGEAEAASRQFLQSLARDYNRDLRRPDPCLWLKVETQMSTRATLQFIKGFYIHFYIVLVREIVFFGSDFFPEFILDKGTLS